MKSWMDLGVVDTIYEEEQEESSSNSSSLDTASHHSLQARVDIWSQATGLEPNVDILVQGRRFHLHKDPLITGSGYLKRRLGYGACATVPSTITPETFAAVAASFYGHNVLITPFNVAALSVAAELLDVAEEEEGDDVGNLKQLTEEAITRLVGAGREYAEVILRSCLTMMPEAEETACLASRCIEALIVSTEKGDDANTGDGSIDGVTALTAEEFQLITYSLLRRFTVSHDPLYKVVSLYLKGNKCKLLESEKNRIAGTIDCNKLSHQVLMQAVQNPNMPLRFVVQVMMAEHFNTRRSVFKATESESQAWKTDRDHQSMTLGAMLQRDAALRHVAKLKAAMKTTSERIRSVESDLTGMKKRLQESERRREALEETKSASFRFSSEEEKKEIRRGGLDSSEKRNGRGWRKGKRLGRKLVDGLKSVFRKSVTESHENDSIREEDEEREKRNRPCHGRSRSLA
ncbi:BTB/POZ domain-containing protein At3g49900-like [Aristolochia californica]|uniref:BTB/POZ domain-containing protein At3g49900-like n=1 Tax=Aristolochia californica TaxID=171875 RepID=UPI0035DFFD59